MQDSPDKYRFELRKLLHLEIELIRKFAGLLADEYRFISERDIAALELLLNDKNDLLEQLSGMEQERTRILEGAGFDTGHAAMPDCLHWCDPQNELATLWNDLLSQARACHELNHRNQCLVDLCSRHAREALHVLRGEESGRDTYQADGVEDHRHSSRTLARA